MRTLVSSEPHTSSRSCEKTAETVEDFLHRDLAGAETTGKRTERHRVARFIFRR